MSQCSEFSFSIIIILRDNVLLETDLTFDDIRRRLLGMLDTFVLGWAMPDD